MGGIEMLCVTHDMPHFSGGRVFVVLLGCFVSCWNALCCARGMLCVLRVVWAGCSLRLHIFSLLFRTATVTNSKQDK